MKPDTAASNPARAARGIALHRQIFLVLRDEIARGIAPVGTLTNEELLCERFQVSRITVRRALADLASIGLVERRPGRGTSVSSKHASSLAPEPSMAFVDELRRSEEAAPVEVLEFGLDVAPPNVARLLKTDASVKAMRVLRVRIGRSGEPAHLTDVWVPADLAKGVKRTEVRQRAMYEILVARGLRVGRVIQVFNAAVCDAVRAHHLHSDVGAPMLRMERLMHNTDGRPVQHLSAYLPADRGSVIMETSGESVNTIAGGQIFLDAASTPD